MGRLIDSHVCLLFALIHPSAFFVSPFNLFASDAHQSPKIGINTRLDRSIAESIPQLISNPLLIFIPCLSTRVRPPLLACIAHQRFNPGLRFRTSSQSVRHPCRTPYLCLRPPLHLNPNTFSQRTSTPIISLSLSRNRNSPCPALPILLLFPLLLPPRPLNPFNLLNHPPCRKTSRRRHQLLP